MSAQPRSVGGGEQVSESAKSLARGLRELFGPGVKLYGEGSRLWAEIEAARIEGEQFAEHCRRQWDRSGLK